MNNEECKMAKITNIEHARVFKKQGLPLDMEVTEKVFSAEYSAAWSRLIKAHQQFDRKLNKLVEAILSDRPSERIRDRLPKLLVGIKTEMLNADAFCGRPINGEQDEHEVQLMAYFLTERMVPYVDFFDHVFTHDISFSVSDVPRIFDPE
jgi:hypothetical protein